MLIQNKFLEKLDMFGVNLGDIGMEYIARAYNHAAEIEQSSINFTTISKETDRYLPGFTNHRALAAIRN